MVKGKEVPVDLLVKAQASTVIATTTTGDIRSP